MHARSLAWLAAIAAILSALPAAAAPWYQIKTTAELGDLPRADLLSASLATLNLMQTQLTGRIPIIELRLGQTLLPNLELNLSGALRQDVQEPLTDAASYQAYQARIAWNQAGGIGLNPLYLARIEDANVWWRDPERNGGLQIGQFVLPFGNDDYTGAWVPLGLAVRETPMTEWLSTQGVGLYQGSTGARSRDIGMLLRAEAGGFPYMVGIFNGSGPNRLDDNGAKDYFARIDWKASDTDLIGLSALGGQDQVFPRGFADPGTSVARRRYGIHWHFSAGNAKVSGEWAREQYEGLDAAPREGWVNEFTQPLGDHVAYLTYSQLWDPAATSARSYLAREVVLGDVHALAPGLLWRAETSYRWEFSNPQHAEDSRIMTSIEATLGGPSAPEAKP